MHGGTVRLLSPGNESMDAIDKTRDTVVTDSYMYYNYWLKETA